MFSGGGREMHSYTHTSIRTSNTHTHSDSKRERERPEYVHLHVQGVPETSMGPGASGIALRVRGARLLRETSVKNGNERDQFGSVYREASDNCGLLKTLNDLFRKTRQACHEH